MSTGVAPIGHHLDRAAACGAGASARRSRAWWVYLLVGCLGVVVYYRVPTLPGLPAWLPRVLVYDLISLSAVVALIAGQWAYRPAHRLPWRLLTAAQTVYLAADVCFYTYHDVLQKLDYPAPADVLYLAHYPLLATALLLVVRRRRRGAHRASLLDALIVAAGAGVLSCFFLLTPAVTVPDMTLSARVASVLYPAMDLLVLTMALFLAIGGGRRAPSYYLLGGALGCVLVTDTIYTTLQLYGTYSSGDALDAGWLVSYLLLGAAALHPSMTTLSQPGTEGLPTLTWRRLIALSVASLVAPCAVIVDETIHRNWQTLQLGTGAVALFLLVIARMALLMRSQQAVLRDNARAHAALRSAIGALEAAQSERVTLLRRTVEAAEQERVRVAAELHDGPIQHLAALAYLLDRLGRRLEQGDAAAAAELHSAARARVGDEIVALRRLMVELRPPILDERGVGDAIRDHANAFQRDTGVVCTVTVEMDGVRPSVETETVVYRLVQEALANVAKHAGARAVHVGLTSGETGVGVRVSDDGRGFDPSLQLEFVRDGDRKSVV